MVRKNRRAKIFNCKDCAEEFKIHTHQFSNGHFERVRKANGASHVGFFKHYQLVFSLSPLEISLIQHLLDGGVEETFEKQYELQTPAVSLIKNLCLEFLFLNKQDLLNNMEYALKGRFIT